MTETRLNTAPYPFMPHAAHRQMRADDAKIFALAADMYIHHDLRAAIKGAGGGEAHLAHISREIATGRPSAAWAASNDAETVTATLRKIGEGLK